MKKWLGPLALAAFCAATTSATAQDTTNSEVLAVVDTFFDGLNTADADMMNSVVAEGSLVTFVIESPDRPDLRVRTMEQATAGLLDGGKYYEEYWEPTVLVKGPIAVVWAPYLFDVDGKRSHCGIDVFNLLRLEGEWKITAIQYSVEEKGCPPGR